MVDEIVRASLPFSFLSFFLGFLIFLNLNYVSNPIFFLLRSFICFTRVLISVLFDL